MRKWKKYGFEFLSIFVAVVSAFALNNWNENRKSRNAEEKILAEIYSGLEKDLSDIDMNIFGHNAGNRAINYFRDLLAGRDVFKDSLSINYLNLTRDFVSIQNTSGYETLKSRGFELIENDSLRSQIISLYEYDYNILRKLEEEYYEMQFQQNYYDGINRIISRNFVFDDEKRFAGIETPLRITADEERLLLSYFWKIETNRNFVLRYYADMRKRVERVLVSIGRERDDRY
jgi:hypothetical protein